MRAEIYSYIRGTFPYIILIGIIVFSVLNLCFPNGRRKVVYRVTMSGAFVIYVCVVIFVTLGMRQLWTVHDLKLHPFWSYETVIRTGNPEMLIENIANIALFFPLGVFIRDRWENRSRWQYCILTAFCCQSVFVQTTCDEQAYNDSCNPGNGYVIDELSSFKNHQTKRFKSLIDRKSVV